MPDERSHLQEVRGEETEPTHFVDRWILPYVEDSSLWAVLFVLLAHMVAFVAPVMLFALRDRNIGAMVVAVAMLYGSALTVRWEYRHRGRLSTLTVLLIIIWISGGLGAYFSDKHGFL
jgi:ABC-type multidrug transport system permease subunit